MRLFARVPVSNVRGDVRPFNRLTLDKLGYDSMGHLREVCWKNLDKCGWTLNVYLINEPM